MSQRCKNMTKEHAEFVVWVFLASFVDAFTSTFEGRWLDGRRDERIKRDREDLREQGCDVKVVLGTSIHLLGWNLSIFFAKTTGDGVGVGDSLELVDVGPTLENWANRWYSGELGVVPSVEDPQLGTEQLPDIEALAKAWVAAAFQPGELK